MLQSYFGRRLSVRTLVAGLFAALVLLCGGWAALGMAPQQLILAWRVQSLPLMDAAAVEAAEPGALVLVTGVLAGNSPADHDLVTYALERWEVKTDAEGVSRGRWVDLAGYFPDLRLVVAGRPLRVQGNPQVTLLGAVPTDTYAPDGRWVPLDAYPLEAGTRRYRGLRNGDRVTVLGHKTASGDIAPSHLFFGDRAAFVVYARNLAKNFFLAGLCVMAMAPLSFGLAWVLMG